MCACALLVALLVGCSPDASDDDGPSVKAAFFQDLSVPESLDLVSPSFLAFETAMQRALVDADGIEVEVVQFDTGGDADTAIEMARAVAADPAFVVAVVAPFWSEPPEVSRLLAGAGVPTLSLSPESASPWSSASPPPPGDPAELWRRFVPDRAAETSLLADAAAAASGDVTRTVCLVTDGSDHASAMASAVDAELAGPTLVVDGLDPFKATGTLAASDCAVIVWTGFPPNAREFDEAMRASDLSGRATIDLAGAAFKAVMPPRSVDGERPVVRTVACACADVSIETDLASRTFVNAYQSEHGLAPGIYAVEAWDAAGVVASALGSRVPTRTDMRAAFRKIATYDGVAGTYAFDAEGEQVGAAAGLYTASGTRWLPEDA